MRFPLTIACLGLMATCTYAAPQYSTVVELSENDDVAVLEPHGNPSDNVYRIRSTNGSFPVRKFAMPEGELYIRMQGGNDSLTFDASILPRVTASIYVYGGAGNDKTEILNLDSAGAVVSDDYDGNNTLCISNSVIDGNVSAFDGPGFQTVKLLATATGSDVLVQSPDGGTRVQIGAAEQRSYVGGSVLIDSYGYGDSSLSLNANICNQYWASLGNGVAYFDSEDSEVAYSVAVMASGGILDLFANNSIIGDSLFAFCGEGETNKQIFNTTIGNLIDFTSYLGYDRVNLVNVKARELNINNGEGGSLLGMSGEIFIDHVRSNSSWGDDEVDIDVVEGDIYELNINAADGNGRLELSGELNVGGLTYASGGGFDIVTLTSTVIEHQCVVYNWGGGSDVIFNDVYVGGTVDVQALDGTDIFRIYDSVFDGPVTLATNNGTDTLTLSNVTAVSDFVADGGFDFDILETANNNVFGGLVWMPEWEFVLDF